MPMSTLATGYPAPSTVGDVAKAKAKVNANKKGVSDTVKAKVGDVARAKVKARVGKGVSVKVAIGIGDDDGSNPPGGSNPKGGNNPPGTGFRLPPETSALIADLSAGQRRMPRKKCLSILQSPGSYARDMVAICRVLQLAKR
jgi:hypothetical protein